MVSSDWLAISGARLYRTDSRPLSQKRLLCVTSLSFVDLRPRMTEPSFSVTARSSAFLAFQLAFWFVAVQEPCVLVGDFVSRNVLLLQSEPPGWLLQFVAELIFAVGGIM